MSIKLNLTPADLQFIINSMESMKNSLNSEASELERATLNIKTRWEDDAYETFQSQMILFTKQLKMMADQLENEKQRVIKYQQGTNKEAQDFRNP